MNTEKKNFAIIVILLGIFLLFLIGLKKYNVAKYEPKDFNEKTEKQVEKKDVYIGFSSINKAVFDKCGQKESYDNYSDKLLYLVLATVGIFGLIGFTQMLKKKSLLKVDTDLLILGGFYVTVVVLYVLFDKMIFNYRPVIEKGKELEASFPSSHTLVTVCFLGACMVEAKIRLKNSKIFLVNVLCVISMIAMGMMRLLAGMHWFTDVVGAYILGLLLVVIFDAVVKKYNKSDALSFSK